MKTQLPSISILLGTLLVSATALAKPVTVKDWSLDDTGPSCKAVTNRVVDGQTFQFELTFDKSGLYPVEAWVREVPATATTKAFRFTTETKPLQTFAFAPIQDSTGQVLFWQVPQDTNSLISYIKRQTRLLVHSVTPEGAATPTLKPVDFSLRGSSAVIDAMVTQCNKGQAIVKSTFEQSFVPAQLGQLDPLKLSETQTAQLRALYQEALTANAQKDSSQKALTALNTQYAKQIQELAKVTGTLDQLTQKELAGLQTQKTTIQGKIASLEGRIASQQTLIDKKESEVVTANGIYDQAWKVIAPLEPEYKRLSSTLEASRSDLKNNQARLAEIDNAINSKNNLISSYDDEVRNLRNQLSQVESQAREARTLVDRTENTSRGFDTYREREERLRDHPVIRYCRYNRQNDCSRLIRDIESRADDEVNTLNRRLSDNVDIARRNFDQKSNQASQISSKIRNYLEYDIPNLRNQIADLRSQRPSVESAITRSRNEVTNKTAALQSYDQSVGYSEKKADLNAKSAVVVKLQGELKNLEIAKTSLTKELEQQNRDLAATDKKIQDVLAKIRASQDRSSELNQALTPYFTEKARIEADLANLNGLIQRNKQEFARISLGV